MGWWRSKLLGTDQRAQSWDPKRTLAGLYALGGVSLLIGAVVGWGPGERFLLDYAETLERRGEFETRVILMDTPDWVSPLLRDQLRETVAREIDDSLRYDRLRQAAGRLAIDPWVEGVPEVRHRGGGTVTVSATYRRPIAVVASVDGYHPVDDDGVRLPGLYLQQQLMRLDLPVIVGVGSAPPDVGAVWGGDDLVAGLKLVTLLTDEPYWGQVRGIDVGHRDTRHRVRVALLTDHGMVRWGFPPGDERSIEPDARIKKERLGEVYRQRGGIDAGDKVVDVSGAAVFVHDQTSSTVLPTRSGGGAPGAW